MKQPNDNAINALHEIGLSEVIPDLRYSNLFEVWFFTFKDMQFGVDRDGVIILFSLEKW
jgi:hypothetical protein